MAHFKFICFDSAVLNINILSEYSILDPKLNLVRQWRPSWLFGKHVGYNSKTKPTADHYTNEWLQLTQQVKVDFKRIN